MADMFTPMVARNPNATATGNYATPMWNEAASRLKYDVNPKNDPFGFRRAGATLNTALGSSLQTQHPELEWQRNEADQIMPTGVFFDPYSGADNFKFGGKNYNIADLAKNDSNLASIYSDYTNKFNQWKSQQTNENLGNQIRQFAGSYKDLPNLGTGGTESAINRINSNMFRYGISDLNQISSRTGANGKPEYYNNLTGQTLPDQFGHFKSNHQGTLRVKLGTDPNTGKTILRNDWTSPKKQFGDYAGDVVLGSLLALAGGAAYGAMSGGAGAGAGEAAAAGSGEAAAGSSAGTYAPVAEASWSAPSTGAGTASGYSAGQLGSGLSSAGSSFGGGLGDVFGAGTGMSGGSTIGTGVGELGSGTSFLGGMAPIEGLGTASTAGSGLLGNLKNIYDGASTASKVYNAATGGGGTGSGTGTTQGGTGGMMTNANVLPLLAALYGQNNNTPDKLQEIARAALERGDPFGPQRAGYATKLAETYTDPQKVYDENYGALDKTFFNEMMAQDAARGRATDAYKRGTEREAKFQDWLNNYRGQLGGFAGANIDPSRMAGEYMASMNNAALLNNYNNQAPIQALGSLFGSGNGSGGLSLNDLISGGKSLYNTGSDLWDWGSSFFGE